MKANVTKTSRIVSHVSENTMDGDNILERKLNAFLTKRFIVSVNIPADECLSEAKKIISIVKEFTRKGY